MKKYILASLLSLALISCKKDLVTNNSITANTVKGKWFLQDVHNKAEYEAKKSGGYQNEETPTSPNLPAINLWEHVAITDNVALLVTTNSQVTNLGSFFINDNTLKLLDFYENDNHYSLAIELVSNTRGFAIFNCDKINDEDEMQNISNTKLQVIKQ